MSCMIIFQRKQMELTKEEMRKIILWLEIYRSFLIRGDIDKDLPSVVNKFKTYLKGGENNG